MQGFEKKANPKEEAGFILGSGSPRRKELLGDLLQDFAVLPSDAEEIASHPAGPLALVMENARIKGPIRWSGSTTGSSASRGIWRKRGACSAGCRAGRIP